MLLEFGGDQPDAMVEAANLVVVAREVLSGDFGVDHVGRDDHVLGIVLGGFLGNSPTAVGVDGGEPEEEGLVLGAVLGVIDPILLLSGASSAGDAVKGPVLISEHVVLSGKHGVVTCFPQELGKADLFLGQADVQLGRPCVMRIAPGDDAASGGAAAARGQVGVVEAHALLGQGVGVGRLDDGMPVASEILLGGRRPQ